MGWGRVAPLLYELNLLGLHCGAGLVNKDYYFLYWKLGGKQINQLWNKQKIEALLRSFYRMIIYYAIWDKFQVILKIKISIKPWYFLVRASLVFLGALLNLVKLLSTQTGSSARVRPPRLTLTRITNNNNGKCSPPHHRKRHATLSAERHCLHFQSLLLHLSTKAFGSDARCAIPQRQHFIPDCGSQPLILHFFKPTQQLSICRSPWEYNSRHWRSWIQDTEGLEFKTLKVLNSEFYQLIFYYSAQASAASLTALHVC